MTQHPGDQHQDWRPRLAALVRKEKVLVVWLVIGLIGRGVLVHSAWGSVDSDEAAGMLMASRAAHGQFFSLFWGGNYGGTLVTVIDGVFVRVFGLHILVFRVIDIALLVVATVLLRLVAGRLTSPRAATAAAVLFWVAPPGWVRFSLREYVWWVPGICLALGVALCCLRWNERRTDRRLWPIGLFAGAAFWLYLPLMALVAPPMLGVAWVLRRRPAGLIRLVALAPLGALPWLYTTFAHHFGTLQRTGSGVPVTRRLMHAVTQVLPASLLTAVRIHPSASVVAALGIVIVVAVAAFVVWQATRRRWLLALAGTPVLLWPLVLATSGVADTAVDYRYGFIVVPPLAVLVAYLFQQLRLALVVPVAAAAVTVAGASQLTSSFAAAPAYDPGLRSVSATLVSQDRTHVYAGYWLSYVLSVASDERVSASPTATVRDLHYARLAENAPRTTYVFDAGLGLDQQMTSWSQAHHAGRRVMVANYAIWEFSGPMPLGTIPLDGYF